MSTNELHAGAPAQIPAPSDTPWRLPSPRKIGIMCLIITESALFTIFVVAYIWYMGKSLNPPYPSQVLEFPWLGSIALFSSSFTIIMAEKMLRCGNKPGFHAWWGATIGLGAYFLFFTAGEWWHLIAEKNLAISTNVFGSTFYALVGLHGSHVIIGLALLSLVWVLSLLGKVSKDHGEHLEMISWYWHFVDAIWLVVVTVVYIISTRY